ncbi:MAG: hypothetical protein A2W22_05480 [Candidatus Levybacteria bacterium RBG_16_35_11]|nr:MAG: hypothetical protein A2W22_05480 [Candidatus Levybacteria bacterium RBG_16_35_11]
MPELDLGGDYVNLEDAKNRLTLTIMQPHKVVEKEFKGEKTQRNEMLVELPNKKQKIWSANKISLREIGKHFGTNSDLWVGKQVQLAAMRMPIKGSMVDVVYAIPMVNGVPVERVGSF